MFLGRSVLYVVWEQGDHYAFVGECYCHGLMDGETMDDLEQGKG